MSIKRNKEQDRNRTAQLLIDIQDINFKFPDASDDLNWLGHNRGSGAHTLDLLLLYGATLGQLDYVRTSIKEHLYHLQHVHGINVLITDGIFKMVIK